MSVPAIDRSIAEGGGLILAVGPTAWEEALLASLRGPALRMTVDRRCVDAVELLAAVQTTLARTVVISTSLPRLDLVGVRTLIDAGCTVIGVRSAEQREDDRVLRQWGVRDVVPVDPARPAGAAAEIAAVRTSLATAGVEDDASAGSDQVWVHQPGSLLMPPGSPAPHASLRPVPDLPSGEDLTTPSSLDPMSGAVDRPPVGHAGGGDRGPRRIAVWGPPGSPGRTRLAIGLADEAASIGLDVLLLDADIDAPSVVPALAVLDPGPGLPVALRRATAGRLDPAALAGLCIEILPRLSVLPGAGRPGHRADLRPAPFGHVRRIAASAADLTVMDLGCVALPVDGVGEQAGLAVLDSLDEAEHVLVVGGVDPVSVQRLVHALESLSDALPDREPVVVIVGVSESSRQAREIRGVLEAHASVPGHRVWCIPADVGAHAAALREGLTLREAAPRSRARAAQQALLRALLEVGSGDGAVPVSSRAALRSRG